MSLLSKKDLLVKYDAEVKAFIDEIHKVSEPSDDCKQARADITLLESKKQVVSPELKARAQHNPNESSSARSTLGYLYALALEAHAKIDAPKS